MLTSPFFHLSGAPVLFITNSALEQSCQGFVMSGGQFACQPALFIMFSFGQRAGLLLFGSNLLIVACLPCLSSFEPNGLCLHPIKNISFGLATASSPHGDIFFGLAAAPPHGNISFGLVATPPHGDISFYLAAAPPHGSIIFGLAATPPHGNISFGLAATPPHGNILFGLAAAPHGDIIRPCNLILRQ
jgi:hypothetical protein